MNVGHSRGRRIGTTLWLGTALIVIGVTLQVKDFVDCAAMDFRMANMPWSSSMLIGMLCTGIGFAIALASTVAGAARSPSSRGVRSYRIVDCVDTGLTGRQIGLVAMLAVGIMVDGMKPATIGFIMPGMRAEYGISATTAALLPLCALTGTAVGSVVWGLAGDLIGRRPMIILSALLFVGTSACGTMPTFEWNLAMCFVMGMTAGGMIPVSFALVAEILPARGRAISVLMSGVGLAGGYLLAAGMSMVLIPHWTWRSMWLLGIPTGMLLLLFTRWIPESPRFLLARNRFDQAEDILQRYGLSFERGERTVEAPARALPHYDTRSRRTMLAVCALGLGGGLINYGFITFLPSILELQRFRADSVRQLLFAGAAAEVAASCAGAYLYGRYGARSTIAGLSAVTACALVGLGTACRLPGGLCHSAVAVFAAILVSGSGAFSALLPPYAAEVFPTLLRGTAGGVASGAAKVGGIAGSLVGGVALSPSIGPTATSVIVTLPLLLGTASAVRNRDRTPDSEPMAHDYRDGLATSPNSNMN